eukprot:TRINITY_DN4434_c0_g1_i7.p1 TRINITY_DN4434_c0_g1~~TRINITY_DN4434_c0_g1_i7.p1  ORF type:complete len:407 (+),score=37.63 TRINITY_DN4434_c0_g1_i7:49-1269(+)
MQTTPSNLGCYSNDKLVKHYQERIESFDQERRDLLLRLEQCTVKSSETHQVEWEIRKRSEEIRELQKALSDAHIYLFAERERLLQVQSENDELKLQQLQDRRRIQHLLNLSQPLEQEINYSKGCAPQAMPLLPRNVNAMQRYGVGISHQQQLTRVGAVNVGNNGGGQERVLRTVYLPVANADALMLKLESVQAQLNEQQQFANERICALLEDRRIREQDYEAHIANYARQIDQITQKLSSSEEALRQTTKDYIIAKKQKQEIESKMAEESANTNQEKQKLAKQLEQNKIQRLNKRCAELEHRRALDLEGFTNDVTILRKQLAAIDRRLHQMRILDRLEDENKLEELLSFLEKRAPDVRSSVSQDDQIDLSHNSQTAKDLRKIRQALSVLGERIQQKKIEAMRQKKQ